MIRNGESSAHKVGTHTRLKTEEVDAVLDRRRNAQRAAFDALRDLEESDEKSTRPSTFRWHRGFPPRGPRAS
ncbi:hypothetical protein [Austwickia chelonae]|uniref:hypothetical protein n=1 Tax=Austwickia chelonae TaxID=100225 RepID=UPI001F0791CE